MSNATLRRYFTTGCLGVVFIFFGLQIVAQVSFTSSNLTGISLENPTTLQFGPDGRLYIGQQDGTIFACTISRNAIDDYVVTHTETITLIKEIPNHDDDGSYNPGVVDRQLTGLLTTGTSENPELLVSSSDPRMGGGPGGEDLNLDTNSGIISRLQWSGTEWIKTDLVIGLPRSEENHSSNGLQLDPVANILYLAQGGHTNAGAPSNNFTFTCEYALSGAILKIDLNDIENNYGGSYTLPTLDDPSRLNHGPSGEDTNDPFGGNDGLNQAKLVPGGPVQIHSPGYRNIYDLVLTSTPEREGRIYTIDNGANVGWGGHPQNEGSPDVTNQYLPGEPGSTGPGPNDDVVNNLDQLHLVSAPGITPIYGGHPNPVRANPGSAGLFWQDEAGLQHYKLSPTIDWPPVPLSMANPIEADFQNPGVDDGALYTWGSSTNGLVEYTATNFFSGALTGDLLTASFDGKIYRIKLAPDGKSVTKVSVFASGIGSIPLDITTQGSGDIFQGTIWAVTYVSGKVTVFEPDTPPDNIAPNAAFSASPTSGTPPLEVSFDASASNDTDGSIVSYAWDFGNGTNASGKTVQKVFHTSGRFNVVLTVTDDDGGTGTAFIEIEVTTTNQLPTASFIATPQSGKVPLTVSLDGSGSSDPDGLIKSFSWDFGNGTIGSGSTTNVTFDEAGNYQVVLTVTDNEEATATASLLIQVTDVNQPPFASFNFTPESGEVPLVVNLDASDSKDADGEITSYNWDFGNGKYGKGKTVDMVYSEPGKYLIQLIVIDNEGALAATSKEIEMFDLVLSTEESDFSKDIQLFPNPVQNQLIIRSNQNIPHLELMIYDNKGRMIIKRSFENLVISKDVHIPADQFRPGVYTITVITGKHHATYRMVKK